MHDTLHGSFASLTAIFCAHTSHDAKVRQVDHSEWVSLVAAGAVAAGVRLPAGLVFAYVVPRGTHGLSLPRFLQALCVLADVKANPHKRAHLQWSVAAAAAEHTKADSGGGDPPAVDAAANAAEADAAAAKAAGVAPVSLDAALETLLRECILPKAHRDDAAEFRAKAMQMPEVQAAVSARFRTLHALMSMYRCC